MSLNCFFVPASHHGADRRKTVASCAVSSTWGSPCVCECMEHIPKLSPPPKQSFIFSVSGQSRGRIAKVIILFPEVWAKVWPKWHSLEFLWLAYHTLVSWMTTQERPIHHKVTWHHDDKVFTRTSMIQSHDAGSILSNRCCRRAHPRQFSHLLFRLYIYLTHLSPCLNMELSRIHIRIFRWFFYLH